MKFGDDIVGCVVVYLGVVGIFLDIYVEGVFGGMGVVFDWLLVLIDLSKFLVLVGGLMLDNVGRVVEQVKFYVVDVSGGVEVSKGIKDVVRVCVFVDVVCLWCCDEI